MSPACCSVPSCKALRCKDSEISFHKFPAASQTIWVKDKFGKWEKERVNRRQLWIKALKIEKKINQSMTVCSLHFLPEDIYIKNKNKMLKKNAVPTMSLPDGKLPEKTTFVAVCEKNIKEECFMSDDEQNNRLRLGNGQKLDIIPKLEVAELETDPDFEIQSELEIKLEIGHESELKLAETKKTFNGGASCAVAKCRNYRSKTGPSVSYHKFPKEFNLRKIWMEKCQRWRSFPTDMICSIHFTPDDFERDLKNELLGLPLIRKLKKSALPSLFLPTEEISLKGQNIKIVLEEENELEKLRKENIQLEDSYHLLKNKYNTKIKRLECQIKYLQSALSIYDCKSLHNRKRSHFK